VTHPTKPDETDTRQRLLDAAFRVAAREGVEGVSVRAVAKEADVYLAAVHYHFGTKDELLAELMRGLYDVSLDVGAADAMALPPGMPRVRFILEGWLQYWKVETDLIFFEILAHAVRRERQLEYLRGFYDSWTERLLALLEQDGTLTQDELRGLAVLMRMLTDGIGIDRIVQASSADRELAVSLLEQLLNNWFESRSHPAAEA